MTRTIARTLGLTVLLMAATPLLTSPARANTVAGTQSPVAALAHSYIVTLNRSLATGNFSGLGAMFEAGAAITERSALSPQGMALSGVATATTTVRGRSAIVGFYRHLAATAPGTRWVVGSTHQVSATTIVLYAQAAGAGSPAMHSTQRLTERNGRIANLTWTIYYLQ
jgi:hypothetical protein